METKKFIKVNEEVDAHDLDTKNMRGSIIVAVDNGGSCNSCILKRHLYGCDRVICVAVDREDGIGVIFVPVMF
jgi:hypothetical protein